MQQLSSSWTLPVKIFFPVFFLGFFGSFALTVLLTDVKVLGSLSVLATRIILVLVLLILTLVYYRWIVPLKRVDADDEFIYVSNYFKTIRFKLIQVKGIEVKKNLINTKAVIHLFQNSSFGENITFLPSKPRLEAYLALHPLKKKG